MIDRGYSAPVLFLLAKLIIGTSKGFIRGKALSTEGHTHNASNITSGTLPVNRGGTGYTSLASLKSALGIPSTTPIGFTKLMDAQRRFPTSGQNTISAPALNYPANTVFLCLRAVISSLTFVKSYGQYAIRHQIGWPSHNSQTPGLITLPNATEVSQTIYNVVSPIAMGIPAVGGTIEIMYSDKTATIPPQTIMSLSKVPYESGNIQYSNVDVYIQVIAYGIAGLTL